MKYLLLIYMDENAMSDTDQEHCYGESAQLAQELHTKETICESCSPSSRCNSNQRSSP